MIAGGRHDIEDRFTDTVLAQNTMEIEEKVNVIRDAVNTELVLAEKQGHIPLEALTPEVTSADASLLPIPRARLLTMYNPQAWYGAGQYFAPNPDFGADHEKYRRYDEPRQRRNQEAGS